MMEPVPKRLEDAPLSIDSVSSAASAGSALGLYSLKKSLDQEAGHMAQLLQALPAPQPAHLGGNVDIRV